MTLPAGFSAALAFPHLRPLLWLEIEGLPYAFGNKYFDASFFTGRTLHEQRDSLFAYMTEVPAGVEQDLSPWEATSSVGALEVSLVDPDDGPVLAMVAGVGRTDNLLHLSIDMAAGDSPSYVDVVETPDASYYSTGPGRLYIGRETFTYSSRSGSRFSGIQRNAYRLPGQTETFAHLAGAEVSCYPRFLVTRRAAFFVALDDTDAGRVDRWGGTITDAAMLDGLVGVKVSMESIEGELKRPFFGGQRHAKLACGLVAADGSYDDLQPGEPAPSTNSLELDPASVQGAAFVEDAYYHVRVDDEYFVGKYVSTGLARPHLALDATGAGRRCYSSAGEAHGWGAEVMEILHVGPSDSAGPPEIAKAKFSTASHPLELLMQILISGSGSGGSYDTLPTEYGMGLPSARVDVAGIEALRDQWLPGVRHIERIEETQDFKAWVATLLRPYRCYPLQLPDGRLSVRRLNPPVQGIGPSVRSITANAFVAIPTWEANVREVFGRVVFKCDYDPANQGSETEPWKTIYKIELLKAQEQYAGRFKEMVIEAPGQWSGAGIAWTDTGASETAQRLADGVRQRLSSPWPLLGLECDYSFLDVALGELVYVTAANVPNVLTGSRGISGVIFEVVRKTVDDARAVVNLTLSQTAFGLGSRLCGPSGEVVSWTAGTGALVLQAHTFTGADQPHDAAYFTGVGYKVAIWSPDLYTARATATISSQSGDTVYLSGATAAPQAGDVITMDYWAIATAEQRAFYACMADDAGFFGTTPGDVYAS